MVNSERLKLSAEPDGFGFFYGWVERDGEHVRVDVLPPEHLWRGDIKLEGHKPDPKAWVIYLDGEELARLERREDLAAVLLGIEGSIASGKRPTERPSITAAVFSRRLPYGQKCPTLPHAEAGPVHC